LPFEIKHFLQGQRSTDFRKERIPPSAQKITLKNLHLLSQSFVQCPISAFPPVFIDQAGSPNLVLTGERDDPVQLDRGLETANTH